MKDSDQLFSESSSDDEQLDENIELLNIIKDKKIKSADEKKTKIDAALASGANINFQDLNSYKRTALYYASKNGEKEIVDYLLLNGARVIAEDKKANPLKYGEKLKQKALPGSAEEQNYIEIIDALKTHISLNDPQPSTSHFQTSKTSTSIFIDEGSKERKRKISDTLEDVFSKKLKDDLPVKSETYKASGLKRTLHGISYQLKLLMLYAKRCHSANIQYKLATEMYDAERFDDLVLEYINPDDKTKHGIFLQSKHIQKENEDSIKIKASDLLSKSISRFSLLDFFDSYQKIKKNYKFKDQSKTYFIIHTNINFEFDDESNILKKLNSLYLQPISTRIAPFNVEINYGVKKSQFYKLVGSNHKTERKIVVEELISWLKPVSDFILLAKLLAKRLIYNQMISLDTPFLKKYQASLVKQIIDTKKNKLRKEFINLDSDVSSDVKEFREVLFTYLVKMLKAKSKHEQSASNKELLQIIGKTIDHSKKKPKLEVDYLQHFWNKVGEILLKISVDFKEQLILDKNPTLDNPEKSADGIFCLIKKIYDQNILKHSKISDTKSRTSSIPLKLEISKTNPLIDEIYKFAGHILVEDVQRVVTFSENFLNKKRQLVGNLEDFRTKLKIKLEEYAKINFDELTNCTFQIMNFVTCKENEFANLLASDTDFPTKEGNEKEIEGFINDLIFAVNQPNENELDKIINKEIGEDFNLIDSELVMHDFEKRMTVWFYEKEGRYLKNEEIDAYFNKIKKKISQFILIGPTSEYIYKLQKTGIVFVSNALPVPLLNFLNSSKDKSLIKYKFCHLNTAKTSPLLGSVKVNQTLKETEEDYSRDDSFISIFLNTLLSIPDHVLKAFKKDGAQLLIVECNSKKKIDEEYYKILNELKLHLDDSNKKRLLLIGPTDNPLIQNFYYDYSESCLQIKDKSDFKDLTETSQEHLLQSTCKFQDYEVVLNQLFENTVTNVTNSIILAELLDNENIFEIGNPIPSFVGYDKNYFIKRTFWQGLEKNSNDSHKSVKIDNLFNDLLEQSKQNMQKNFIIISGVAGMGKSTIFTHLSHKIKEQSKDHWVVKIELSRHTDVLKECTSFTTESAIDFISHDILNIQRPFERELFKHLFEKKKVVLLLDGFDEIYPNYEKTVLNLLEALEKTDNLLWVTTRPDLKDRLENNLKDRVAFYNLEPFAQDDKTTFLTKFWSKNLKCDKKMDSLSLNVERINIFAKELLKSLKKSIKNNEFTGIPLQTRMLAEAFEGEVSTFHNDLTKNEPTFLDQFDILDLYAKFYKAKYDIVSQKGGVVQDNTLAIINYHGLNDLYSNLALLALFPEQEDCLTIKKQKLMSVQIARFGIAEIIDRKEIKFIHRTYAEYSVAEFFSEALINNEPKEACNYFLTNILLKNNCQVIRYFTDCFLKKNFIPTEFLKKYGEEIDKTYKQEKNKTILHTAAKEGNPHIVQFLSNCLKDKYQNTLKSLLEERYENQLAWHDAAKAGHVEVLKLLWEWDKVFNLGFETILLKVGEKKETAWTQAAKVGHFVVLEQLWQWAKTHEMKTKLFLLKDFGYGRNAFHFAASNKNTEALETLKNWAKEIQFDFEKDLLLFEDNDKQTAFHIATQFGHVGVVKILRDWATETNLDSQKLLLSKDINRQTAFHIATKFSYVDIAKILQKWAMETNVKLEKDLLFSENINKQTAFHLAADEGCIEVLQMFRDWATKTNSDFENDLLLPKDINEQTAFHLAAVKGHVEVLTILKNWATVSDSELKNNNLLVCKDIKGQTAFHLAAGEGHVEVLKKLLSWATEFDSDFKKNFLLSKDNNEQTAFHLAAEGGHVEILTILKDWATKSISDFKNNLLLLSKDINEKTAFHLVASKGHIEVLKTLRDWTIETDSDFEMNLLLSKDIKGQTAFHLAAGGGHVEILKILRLWGLAGECDFKEDLLLCQDTNGQIARRLAADSRHAKVAEMLKRWKTQSDS